MDGIRLAPIGGNIVMVTRFDPRTRLTFHRRDTAHQFIVRQAVEPTPPPAAERDGPTLKVSGRRAVALSRTQAAAPDPAPTYLIRPRTSQVQSPTTVSSPTPRGSNPSMAPAASPSLTNISMMPRS